MRRGGSADGCGGCAASCRELPTQLTCNSPGKIQLMPAEGQGGWRQLSWGGAGGASEGRVCKAPNRCDPCLDTAGACQGFRTSCGCSGGVEAPWTREGRLERRLWCWPMTSAVMPS